jgi:hypothetical protein
VSRLVPKPSPPGRKPRPGDDPPYYKYAFANPYNLTLLAAAATTAAATGHWWMALCAGAGEALWMLFAPDSTFLRRAWFDKVWIAEKDAEKRARQEQQFARLAPNDQQRCLMLRAQQQRIHDLAAENPSFTVDLLRNDLAKLEGLVDDFLELALTCNGYERHLENFDVNGLEQNLRYYQHQVENIPKGDDRREIAQKNLDVLLQRKERYGELIRNLQAARGQMELMEHTFRLLADDIVTMHNGAELGDRLDDLRNGVEAVRETSKETEHLLQAVERR